MSGSLGLSSQEKVNKFAPLDTACTSTSVSLRLTGTSVSLQHVTARTSDSSTACTVGRSSNRLQAIVRNWLQGKC